MNGHTAATSHRGSLAHLRGRRALLLLVLGSKVVGAVVVVLAYAIFPSNVRNYHEHVDLAYAFTTWDGNHYLWLSQQWYVPGHFENNFYPLFPALIALVNSVVGDPFTSGLLVSNLLSVAAFYAFYRFVENTHGASVATGALTFLIAFPTAFYLSLVYSESLFLLLAVSVFLFLSRGAYVRSWLSAVLLPLTRPLGIAIVVPLLVQRVVAVWRDDGAISSSSVRIGRQPSARWTIALCSAPLIGFGAYFVVMWLATGNPSEGIAAQRMSVGSFSIGNLLHPELFLHNLMFEPPHLASVTTSLVDRLFFVFFLAVCPLVYRTCGAELFAYTLVMGFTPPLLGSFMSYKRFLLPIFPLFIALSSATESGRFAPLRLPLLVFFAALQVVFLALHALNYWVA
jgi:hypothetical protein